MKLEKVNHYSKITTYAAPIIAGILYLIFDNNPFTYILAIITALAGLITYITGRKLEKEKQKRNIDLAEKEYQGFGIFMIVSISNIDFERRKFIIDIGDDIKKNRVSIYLDKANNLIYRIIDAQSESHIIKVPQRMTTFQINTKYFLYVDYGYSDGFSFMRIFINDKEVGRNEYIHPIDMPKEIKKMGMILGADIEKQNFGKFTISELGTSHVTFTKKHRDTLISSLVKLNESLKRSNPKK